MIPIYLDWSATTPICETAKKVIVDHLDDFGNPSSSYECGFKTKNLIEDARERIAKCINAEPNEIYFTSGGSEANTWALMSRNSLASNIEHHSIRSTFQYKVNSDGLSDCDCIEELIKEHQVRARPIELVSCMAVNNEIGTIQPIQSIAEIAHKHNVLFHTDAVQAAGHLPIDVKEIGCDMLSASAHKFGGCKGSGFLFVRNGIDIKPLVYGGKQESSFRGGTENVLGILAMAMALEDSVAHMEERNFAIKHMRDTLLDYLLSLDGVKINGSMQRRVDSNINISIDGVKGQDVMFMADNYYNINISTGSACNEGQNSPSHVLKAIGLSDEESTNSIRITLGYTNTMEELYKVEKAFKEIIETLRKY